MNAYNTIRYCAAAGMIALVLACWLAQTGRDGLASAPATAPTTKHTTAPASKPTFGPTSQSAEDAAAMVKGAKDALDMRKKLLAAVSDQYYRGLASESERNDAMFQVRFAQLELTRRQAIADGDPAAAESAELEAARYRLDEAQAKLSRDGDV